MGTEFISRDCAESALTLTKKARVIAKMLTSVGASNVLKTNNLGKANAYPNAMPLNLSLR